MKRDKKRVECKKKKNHDTERRTRARVHTTIRHTFVLNVCDVVKGLSWKTVDIRAGSA